MGTTLIGFIGLGSLGSAIALNLAERDHLHYVYNRDAAKARAFAEETGNLQGMSARPSVSSSIKELASACDIIFSVVSDDAAVKAITEGPDGLAANLKKGGIHISMSTILPATAEVLEQLHNRYGNYYIASPVIGRPEAAKARKLNLCVAGHPEAVGRIGEILSHAGAVKCWSYGEIPGNANTAKLCTNFMLIAAIESMAEGLSLAERSGVDKSAVMTMLGETIFNCPIYINYGNTILREKFLPAGFSLQLALKDMRLVGEQADRVQLTMPFVKTLQPKMEQYVGKGLGSHDLAALALPERE